MQFKDQIFTVSRVIRAGIPKPLGADEIKRYFQKREYHGLIFYYEPDFESCYRILSEGTERRVKCGQLLFLPKGVEYEVLSPTRPDVAACYFINFDTVNELSLTSKLYTVKNFSLFRKLFVLANEAQQDVFAGKAGAEENLLSLLYRIISELKQELISEGSAYAKRRKIAPAAEFILAHPEDNRSVTELAALCGFKPPFFRKCFRQAMGVSPIVFRNNAKIAKAQRLIEQTTMPLPEICIACGIDDYYYFCRLFKRVTGYPPGKYSKSIIDQL